MKIETFPLDENDVFNVLEIDYWVDLTEIRKRLANYSCWHEASFGWATIYKCLYNLMKNNFIIGDNGKYKVIGKNGKYKVSHSDSEIIGS